MSEALSACCHESGVGNTSCRSEGYYCSPLRPPPTSLFYILQSDLAKYCHKTPDDKFYLSKLWWIKQHIISQDNMSVIKVVWDTQKRQFELILHHTFCYSQRNLEN